MSDKFTRFEKPTSNQDFFNKAWQWLVVENRPQCIDKFGKCLYREVDSNNQINPNGHSCIVGAFIPNTLVHDKLNDVGTAGDLFENSVMRELFAAVDEELVLHIQCVHDNVGIQYDREDRMRRVALQFQLQIPENTPKL